MKTILVLAALVAVVVSLPADTYNPEYDNFNAQELVDNIRLLKNYGKCFLEQGPCTPEGNDFNKVIPEALRTSCAKCTPKQRELVRTVVRGFQTKLPDMWQELVNKEDPKGQYTQVFKEFLESSN
ncbi:allergen Tha p 1-like [Zerene cesonia]|uniref:allergen Tha p 1-like n=1 Tax=Zerene cesonia TaxID=33412 RepID=UPI0018E5234E|nr:allergen Tha p 1-like [Zerene cesonia]